MSVLPPSLSVTVNMKRRACVLDAHLALSRYGLLLAQRLGDEFDLWLVRELWQILDNTQYYLSNPELLIPPRAGKHVRTVKQHPETNGDIKKQLFRDILNQWDLARIETDLAGLKIFWIGDALSESLLPTGVDPNLVHRFETLASSLDLRVYKNNGKTSTENIFADCFRDAAALTAALISHRGFILTRQGHGNEELPEHEPILCSYLRQWGVRCFRVELDQKINIEREFIFPIFARAGISELMWAGLNLAAVHIVVPEAIIIPPLKKEEDVFQKEIPFSVEKACEKKDWWRGAMCFWYPL